MRREEISQLFEKYGPLVYRRALSILKNPEQAQEATHIATASCPRRNAATTNSNHPLVRITLEALKFVRLPPTTTAGPRSWLDLHAPPFSSRPRPPSLPMFTGDNPAYAKWQSDVTCAHQRAAVAPHPCSKLWRERKCLFLLPSVGAPFICPSLGSL